MATLHLTPRTYDASLGQYDPNEYSENYHVVPAKPQAKPRVFVYGRSPTPRRTTDIYLPRDVTTVMLASQEREPLRFAAAVNNFWVSRMDRDGRPTYGHRWGAKGATLRTHREG